MQPVIIAIGRPHPIARRARRERKTEEMGPVTATAPSLAAVLAAFSDDVSFTHCPPAIDVSAP